jgi:hypothetical protein
VKIFNGNKTANWLRQQEYDQEQEDSLMTIPLTAFIIPAKFFSEISEEWSMRHDAVIALFFFYSSTWFRIIKHRKNQCPLCTFTKNVFPRPVDKSRLHYQHFFKTCRKWKFHEQPDNPVLSNYISD